MGDSTRAVDDRQLSALRWTLADALDRCRRMQGDADGSELTSDEIIQSIMDAFRARGFSVDSPEGEAAARNAAVAAWTEIVLMREAHHGHE